MIPALVKELGNTFNKTAGTTLALTTTGATSAGNLIVARVLFDNFTTASKPVVSSITKQAGETANWVFLGAARSTSTSGGSFASGEMWAIQTTVNWSASAYTVTLDSSVTQKAIAFTEFSGVTATQRCTAGTNYSTTTTAASAATTGTTPVTNDLALGFIFGSNVATPQAGDNDTTNGSWSAVAGFGSTGGNVATNNFGIGQYKVLTSGSHQTLNNQAAMTAGNGAIVAILQAISGSPTVTQAAYRFYADGTESGSTALAAQNTATPVTISAGLTPVQLRVLVQSTSAAGLVATDTLALQVELNGSGSWSTIGSGSLHADYYDSAFLAHDEVTTNRLTGGTGAFRAGEVAEFFAPSGFGLPGNYFTEVVYSIGLSPLFANGDVLRFRVLLNGATTGFTYSQTPTINIVMAAPIAVGVSDTTGITDTVSTSITSGNPKLHTLIDTFDTSLDKVGVWSGSSTQTMWESGQAKIPVTTSYYDLSTNHAGGYDFTSSSVYAKITPPVLGNGSRETIMEIIRGGVSNDKLSMFVSGSDIWGRLIVGGTNMGQLKLGTYNATSHAWWKMRESGGTTYFATSPDGTTWSEFWSIANGFDVTNIWLNINSGYWGTESASDAFIDNVNAPAGGVTLIVDVADTVGITDYKLLDRFVSDSISITDNKTTDRFVNDVVGIVDYKTLDRFIVDVAGLVDTFNIAVSAALDIKDNIGITDIVTAPLSKSLDVQDRAGIADTINIVASRVLNFIDSVELIDVFNTAAAGNLVFQDIETLGDSIATSIISTATGRPKVWNGSTWPNKPAKVWTGSAWVEKPVKVWTGSTWKKVT